MANQRDLNVITLKTLGSLKINIYLTLKPSSSISSSSLSSESRSSSPVRRSRAKGGHRRRTYSQSRHLDRGEVLNNFEKLMVITFRTLLELLENGVQPKGFLRHGLTMAEKAASGAYQDRAFIAYDASVRQRASRIGPSAFGLPVNEELIRHFSLENSKRFDTRANGGGARKRKNTCYRYNSETGCPSKECIYVHRCAFCKVEGHPARECRSVDKVNRMSVSTSGKTLLTAVAMETPCAARMLGWASSTLKLMTSSMLVLKNMAAPTTTSR